MLSKHTTGEEVCKVPQSTGARPKVKSQSVLARDEKVSKTSVTVPSVTVTETRLDGSEFSGAISNPHVTRSAAEKIKARFSEVKGQFQLAMSELGQTLTMYDDIEKIRWSLKKAYDEQDSLKSIVRDMRNAVANDDLVTFQAVVGKMVGEMKSLEIRSQEQINGIKSETLSSCYAKSNKSLSFRHSFASHDTNQGIKQTKLSARIEIATIQTQLDSLDEQVNIEREQKFLALRQQLAKAQAIENECKMAERAENQFSIDEDVQRSSGMMQNIKSCGDKNFRSLQMDSETTDDQSDLGEKRSTGRDRIVIQNSTFIGTSFPMGNHENAPRMPTEEFENVASCIKVNYGGVQVQGTLNAQNILSDQSKIESFDTNGTKVNIGNGNGNNSSKRDGMLKRTKLQGVSPASDKKPKFSRKAFLITV